MTSSNRTKYPPREGCIDILWRSAIHRLLAVCCFCGWGAGAMAGDEVIAPTAFVQKHCAECHSGPDAENGFDLMQLSRDVRQPNLMSKWVRLYDRIERQEMPPADYQQPSPAERSDFLKTLGASLHAAAAKQASTVLRRLNRVEFENTLNDLFDIREPLSDLLPEDNRAHGFDNVGEALDLSALHLERYMAAATKAIDVAIRKTPKPDVKRSTYKLGDGKNSTNVGKHWYQADDDAIVVFNNGGFPRPELDGFRAPFDGRYRVKINGYAYQSSVPITLAVWHGVFAPGGIAEKAKLLAFPAREGKELTSHEFTVWLRPNARLAFLPELNVDNAKLRRDGPAKYDGSGLAIHSVEIEGPLFDSWPGRGHELLLGKLPVREVEPRSQQQKKQKWYRPQYEIVSNNPEADVEGLLRKFLPLAFRRPISNDDLAPLRQLAKRELESGASFEQAMRTTYIATLCSPDFLYLREAQGELDDFAIASRLSYAFWNTLPDENLRHLAEKGELTKPEVLREQTERLLRDPRASRFVKAFTGQWLNLRDIDFTIPDKQLYPEYDDALKDAMLAETESFFVEVVNQNLSLLNFIDSNWTMLNERLARHYRIAGVEGHEMRRVALDPQYHRGGVLTHASVLKVSANGTTTSPVVRGVFVMERILGVEPPVPPPGVPGVEPDIRGATTLREQLVRHRGVESCNVCHRVIDPPGFALESYDVIGGWRDNYRSLNRSLPMPATDQRGGARNVQWRLGPLVDASGETFDGHKFAALQDYKQILLKHPEALTRALAEKVAVYMTGRAMGFSDRAELDRISRSVAAKDYRFRDLIVEVARSKLFRHK